MNHHLAAELAIPTDFNGFLRDLRAGPIPLPYRRCHNPQTQGRM
jgi:hypothetical protein